MEEVPVRAPNAEAEPRPVEKTSTEMREAPAVIEPVQSGEDREKIGHIKERLLEAGFMTISPIEGNPFTVSEGHVSNGAGVTFFNKDGSVQKTMTLEEYEAERAKQREAVRYWSGKQKQSAPGFTKSVGTAVYSWVKRVASKLWSTLMGTGRRLGRE